MKRGTPKTAGAGRFVAPWGMLGLAVLVGGGAGLERIIVKNFSVCPAHYPPPNQVRMKSLLEGAQAQALNATQYLVTEAKLQTFQTNGHRELLVETPQCIYNSAQRSVSSSETLRVSAGEGKFSIAGEGFLWQQTNASLALSNSAGLVISNQVHSIVHPDVLAGEATQTPAPGGARMRGGLDVFSDSFDYATDSGLGIYRGKVRVMGTNLNLTAGRLTLELPMQEHQLQRVTAEQAVVADYEGTHATGEKATYATRTSLLEVSGHPEWQSGERQGRGDELTIDATNKIFLARGHAFLRMPSRGLAVSGLLPAASPSGATAPAAPRSFVEVLCDNYDLRTNRAVFRDQVRLSELAGGEIKGKLSCGLLTVSYAGTNQLEKMVAEGGVMIEHEDQRLSSAKAIYEATNSLLELIDAPAWQVGPRAGKGDSIRIDTQREEMFVTGHASMRLPSSQMGQMTSLASRLGPATNSPPPANEMAEIFSDNYSVGRDTARFDGNVRIEHPHISWACRQMTVNLPAAGGRVGKIVADQAVRFDLVDAGGEKIRGSGERAVYTYNVTGAITNELIELTGNPCLTLTNGTFRGEGFRFDCLRHTLRSMPGPYGLRGLGPPANTNTAAWPRTKAKTKPAAKAKK